MPRHHQKRVPFTICPFNHYYIWTLGLLYVFGDDAFRNIQKNIVDQINLPCLPSWALMTDVCHSFFQNQCQGGFGKVAGYHSWEFFCIHCQTADLHICIYLLLLVLLVLNATYITWIGSLIGCLADGSVNKNPSHPWKFKLLPRNSQPTTNTT